jgi:hypothetical protein
MCYSGKCKFEASSGDCTINNPHEVVDYCQIGKESFERMSTKEKDKNLKTRDLIQLGKNNE